MGAAIGAELVRAGHEVTWDPSGRSEATRRRAEQAGLTADHDRRSPDVILSVCPPSAALAVARSLAGTGALYIDANAVSPATAAEIGRIIGPRWVDGGIIGAPPRQAGTSRIYLSGDHARAASELFAATHLEPVMLDGDPVAASAVKMAYASWTKGSAALLLAAMETARAFGVEDPLRAEWRISQPALTERLDGARDSASSKGWRWVGEMEEIARTFSAAGQPPGFHEAAAEVFSRFPRADQGR
jgi:3-hydroxyisobutyrate dehydrogenase-like beta-hydroxyacid dehydrogenase